MAALETETVPSEALRSRSTWKDAYWASMAFAGVQISWAVQIGYTSPTLRRLGMSNETLSYAWLAGPVTGAVVQPLVGIWSDVCTSKLGRRRPFIIVGAIFAIGGLIGFSNAEQLGFAFGDSELSHEAGLSLAIISFWVLDAAINVAQGPQRALMTDTIDAHLLAMVRSMFICNCLSLSLLSCNYD
ncbi:unnamed protein product [Discosporangium mesarthrocarpum]